MLKKIMCDIIEKKSKKKKLYIVWFIYWLGNNIIEKKFKKTIKETILKKIMRDIVEKKNS